MPGNKKAYILLSGGLDSTCCVNFYKESGYSVSALFVNYGQRAYKKEIAAVKRISKFYSINIAEIKVADNQERSSGLIMGRNMLLLSLALYSSKFETGLIGIGVHAGTEYADCSKIFIDSIKKTFSIYTHGKVQVGAPFLKWTKPQIWEYAKQNNVPVKLTYSCELGLKQPCGKCDSCKDLKKLYAIS